MAPVPQQRGLAPNLLIRRLRATFSQRRKAIGPRRSCSKRDSQGAEVFSTGNIQAGYTLLEMLVVLGLLALIAAVSMPLMRGGAETGLIERTAARLAADLMAMRTAAIKRNIDTRLDIDLAANRYWGTPKLSARPLPAGIPIAIKGGRTAVAATSVASILFFPMAAPGVDGSPSGAAARPVS